MPGNTVEIGATTMPASAASAIPAAKT